MPLPDFQSRCEAKQKIVVSKDDRESRRHIAHNDNRHYVSHYRIDGVVITRGEKCDFLLFDEDLHVAFLIELKGSDLVKAVHQLEATEIAIREYLVGYLVQYRIAVSKAKTHAIEHVEFQKFKRKHLKALKYSTELVEDYL